MGFVGVLFMNFADMATNRGMFMQLLVGVRNPSAWTLRSFGSFDAMWRRDHPWSVFGMPGENLLRSAQGLQALWSRVHTVLQCGHEDVGNQA